MKKRQISLTRWPGWEEGFREQTLGGVNTACGRELPLRGPNKGQVTRSIGGHKGGVFKRKERGEDRVKGQ